MSIIAILKRNAKHYAKKIALIEAEQEKIISYGELYKKVENYALFLKINNVQPAQKVAIYMLNNTEYIVAFFALLYLSAIPVLLDYRYCGREIKECLSSTETDMIITSDETRDRIFELYNRTILKKIFVFTQKNLQYPFITFNLDSPRKDIANFSNDISNLEKISIKRKFTNRVILFTYRGLGYALPVILSEKAIETNIFRNNALTEIDENTKISLILPLSHIFALSSNLLSPLSVGATIVIINTIEPVSVLTFFEYYKLNLIAAVPSQIYIFLHCLRKKNFNLSLLKQGVIGGDSFSKDLYQNWLEYTNGSILVQGYGLTETCPAICNNWRTNRPGSIGRVMRGVKAQIRDESGKKILLNKPGRLWIKTNSLMEGYLNQPELNKQTMQTGWFDTGDQVYQDKDGYFYFVKRIKPIAKIGATTVDLLEIKTIISQMPGVKEVQIQLGTDALWQEKIICSIKTDRPLSSFDIKNYCKSYLAYYKIPRDINILFEKTS